MAETAGDTASMRLKVLLPTEVLVDEPAVKVVAEGPDGAFCLLPRHIDFVAALTPGVLVFEDASGREVYTAVDQGVLVKIGRDVRVSTFNAARGDDLGELQQLVEERFLELDEQQRKARTALARLEAGTLRRFRQLQEHGHE